MQYCLFPILVFLVAAVSTHADEPGLVDAARKEAAGYERVWKQVNQDPVPERLSIRDLFGYALALCAANENLDRLEPLFALAESCQDRDPASKSYGNFRWYAGLAQIFDYNAVEFDMENASVLYIRYRDRVPAAAMVRLQRLLDYSIEGCMRHNVRSTYTNIALMNATNLILLGEAMNQPKVLAEGQSRLNSFLWTTWEQGICEYGSPTYYGVDVAQLQRLHAFAKDPQVKVQAETLLRLFWMDIAVNWFPPADRYAGAWSRTYDFPTGISALVQEVDRAGWGAGTPRASTLAAMTHWQPPADLRQSLTARPTRMVRQRWGGARNQVRALSVFPDITLGSSGADYHDTMDEPLAIDLPGGRKHPRIYFIPDGRDDPYGTKKIPEASQHMKARHLRAFFSATQSATRALAVVIFDRTYPPPHDTALNSQLVFPADTTAVFIGARPLSADFKSETVPLNAPVILQYGEVAAAVTIRAAISSDGSPAAITLVRDNPKAGLARLTVSHLAAERSQQAYAVLDVQIFSPSMGLALDAWRRQVASTTATVVVSPESLRVTATDDLLLQIANPAGRPAVADARPVVNPYALELDGREIGRPLLEAIAPIAGDLATVAPPRAQALRADAPLFLKSDTAQVIPPAMLDDNRVIGAAGVSGRAVWLLQVEKAGTYTVWAETIAPDGETDSFFVESDSDPETATARDWHVTHSADWQWSPIRFSAKPHRFTWPAGPVTLTLRTREPGTRLRQLAITASPDWQPGK